MYIFYKKTQMQFIEISSISEILTMQNFEFYINCSTYLTLKFREFEKKNYVSQMLSLKFFKINNYIDLNYLRNRVICFSLRSAFGMVCTI